MSELRFVRQLGAEFERVAEDAVKPGRGWRVPIRGAERIGPAGVGFGLSVVVVGVVVALFAAHARAPSGSAGQTHATRLVFRASPDQQPASRASIDRSVDIVRSRLDTAFGGARISREGNDIVVIVNRSGAAARARVERLVETTGRLTFYDWEANALTPEGKPVARQLQTQNANALKISQGLGSGPGSPGAGSVPFYQAVTLAAKQTTRVSEDNSRQGPLYYMFGAPGSAACAAATKASNPTTPPRTHCLLAGPDINLHDLYAGLPSGIHATDKGVQTLTVPQGIVVLQAADVSQTGETPSGGPAAQFYVLRDHVSLFGNEITHPRASSDQSGQPAVAFGFTSSGAKAFQTVTAAIAHRGGMVSGVGQKLDQHFAVALDDKLITVPSIDFKTYPDGVSADNGADITGDFRSLTARDLAIVLRFGPLPIKLASP